MEKYIAYMSQLDGNLLLWVLFVFGIVALVWLAYKYQITWLQSLVKQLAEDAVKMAEQVWKNDTSTDRYALALKTVSAVLDKLRLVFIEPEVKKAMVESSILACVNELPPSHVRYGINLDIDKP